jgi:hypothetical protein
VTRRAIIHALRSGHPVEIRNAIEGEIRRLNDYPDTLGIDLVAEQYRPTSGFADVVLCGCGADKVVEASCPHCGVDPRCADCPGRPL